ncbi:germination protein YpeB [Oscillospiraceae bacterium OttesenSCG-928-F05]|nr:germination protein YpeB [Oscillospiraceae bacterium OttesenSCG-928-F05]
MTPVKKMRRRTLVRLVSFTASAFAVAVGFAVSGWMTAYHLRWTIESGYQHEFGDLVESVALIDTTLQKGLHANSPAMLASLSTEVSRQSALASSALSGLPFANIELEKTAKFISQAGDFSYYLSRRAAGGQEMDEEEMKNLEALTQSANEISLSLNELYYSINEGSMRLGEVQKAEENMSEEESGLNVVGDSMKEIETQFPEYAGLIYDGPFSEHIAAQEPLHLKEAPEASAEEAKAHLAALFGLGPSAITHTGETNNTIPCYTFEADLEKGKFDVDSTKQGGFVMNMRYARPVESAELDIAACFEKAHQFLVDAGIENLTDSYYMVQSNIVTINFAYMQGDVLCYPDLVKISVAQDDGEIVGFESRGYLANHHERQFGEIKVTREAAEESLSAKLTVEDYNLVVIPSMGKYELYCHEFLCSNGDGQKYLVYINTETGTEEQLLILIENEQGMLTI